MRVERSLFLAAARRFGARVVSHLWDMGDEWPPEGSENVDGHRIYWWTVTASLK